MVKCHRINNIIREAAKKKIGFRKPKVTPNNPQLQRVRHERKIHKKEYDQAICTGNHTAIKESLTKYVKAQKQVKELLEEAIKETLEYQVNKLRRRTRVDMDTLWKIRRSFQGKKRESLFAVKDEKAILDKKKVFLAFIDISKAYDKSWDKAVFYSIWKRGVQGKIWRVMLMLNAHNTARILTRYGLTEPITLEGNLRQGSVLSVIEFSSVLDSLGRMLLNRNLGAAYADLIIPSLLFMDDIAILENNEKRFEEALHIAEIFRKRFKFQFSESKTRILITNGTKADRAKTWKIGNT